MFARHVALGIGAGLVSALLFAVVATGSAPGVFLSYIAPLPVAIAALGWGYLVGLLAVATGGLALSFVLTSSSSLAFALGAALPAWCLSYAALLRDRSAERGGTGFAFSLGHLLLIATSLAAAMVLAGAVALGRGDHATYQDVIARFGEAFLRLYNNAPRTGPLPDLMGVPGSSFVALLTSVTPFAVGGVLTAVLVANLWAGARIVHLSGRLPRPWMPFYEARMPVAALGILLAAFALSFTSGFAGVAGRALLGTCTTALVMQGFALLHAVTRGRPSRPFVLGFAYLLTAIAAGPFLPLMALAGLADVAPSIRRRLGGTLPPDGPTRPPFTSSN